MVEVAWTIKGMEYSNCNCAYGCPCQFNALPTYGDCRYVLFTRIDEGRYQVQNFTDYLEGWWLSRLITALKNPAESSIPLSAIQSKIYDLRENFQIGRLPLDVTIDAMPPVAVFTYDDRPFVRQMRLITISENTTLAAVHDYYRASEQRSRWARENLLLDGEVDRYDRSLCDAWQRHFHAKLEELSDCSSDSKERVGRELFHWARSYPKPLRNRDELWLSSGSYQILADAVRVGWHPDFEILMSKELESP